MVLESIKLKCKFDVYQTYSVLKINSLFLKWKSIQFFFFFERRTLLNSVLHIFLGIVIKYIKDLLHNYSQKWQWYRDNLPCQMKEGGSFRIRQGKRKKKKKSTCLVFLWKGSHIELCMESQKCKLKAYCRWQGSKRSG